jgi:PAS domain S-box-containing protein
MNTGNRVVVVAKELALMQSLAPFSDGGSIPSKAVRYGYAVASVGFAFAVAFLLRSAHVRDPYGSIFLAAISVSVWYGGKGPGALGVILSSLGLNAFLHPPHGWLRLTWYDLPLYCIYFTFTFWIYRFSQSRRRAEYLLQEARDQLETEVQARTAELMQVNAEYQTILHGVPFGIALFGPGRIVLRSNPAYERMIGFAPGELLGQRAPLPESERETWRSQEEQLRAGEQVVIYEAVRIRKNGSEFSATISMTPLFDSNENYIGVVGLIIDNTERHAQEAERQMLGALVQCSPDFIGVTDSSGSVVFVNQAGRRFFGLQNEDQVRQTRFIEYLAEHERQRAAEELIPMLFAQGRIDFEAFGRSFKTGETFPILWTSFVIYDEKTKQPALFASIIKDITEQHRNRIALQESLRNNEALLQENRKLQEKLTHENISLLERNLALQSELADMQRSKFEKIIGVSPALRRTLNKVDQVAATDATVLITGETGVGKELIAQAIHENSKRARMPFRSVNCAALPVTLMAAELFGHEKGAFTGADRQRIGQFELAEGGTLFLDEIAEIPIDMQAALLRVLEEHALQRLGGTKSIPIDVRIVAATNRDLYAAMQAGEFRHDLFYRLNNFPIEMPPLRERKEDIPMLVTHFIAVSTAKHGKSIRHIEKRGMELLRSYDWPGNIRELRNVIDTSVIVSTGEVLSIDEELLFGTRPAEDAPMGSLQKEMSNHERILIERALAETQGRVYGLSGAAAILHLPPTTLSAKMKALKIDASKFKSR